MHEEYRLRLDGWDAHAVTVGSGPALVTLHGGMGFDHNVLRPWLDWLAESWRLVYFDQRGCGRSGGRELLAATTLADWAADVENLRTTLDLGRIVLFGHSAGGGVALEFARRYPEVLRGLVLCDAYPALDFIEETLELVGRRVKPEAFQRLLAYFHGGGGDDDAYREAILGVATAYFASEMPEARRHLAENICFCAQASERTHELLTDYGAAEWLHELAVPTLVLAGRHDVMPTPAAGAQRLAAAFPGARSVLFEASGHMPFVEEPGAFRVALETWLAGLEM